MSIHWFRNPWNQPESYPKKRESNDSSTIHTYKESYERTFKNSGILINPALDLYRHGQIDALGGKQKSIPQPDLPSWACRGAILYGTVYRVADCRASAPFNDKMVGLSLKCFTSHCLHYLRGSDLGWSLSTSPLQLCRNSQQHELGCALHYQFHLHPAWNSWPLPNSNKKAQGRCPRLLTGC